MRPVKNTTPLIAVILGKRYRLRETLGGDIVGKIISYEECDKKCSSYPKSCSGNNLIFEREGNWHDIIGDFVLIEEGTEGEL